MSRTYSLTAAGWILAGIPYPVGPSLRLVPVLRWPAVERGDNRRPLAVETPAGHRSCDAV